MRKIKSGKIRWIINIILILLAVAAFSIAFIPGVQQAMVTRFGPSAYMVFPVLLLCFSVLFFVRLYCVEGRNKSLVTIRSGKIRWALNIVIIIVAAAIACIAFVPGLQQSMVLRYGHSAELVNPLLELLLVVLAIARISWVEGKKNLEQ